MRINFLISCAQTGRLVMSLQIHRNTTNHPVCAFKGSELFLMRSHPALPRRGLRFLRGVNSNRPEKRSPRLRNVSDRSGLVSCKERIARQLVDSAVKKEVLREAETSPAMESLPESQRGSGDRRWNHW